MPRPPAELADPLHLEPQALADLANLRYCTDDKPGYTRRKARVKGGFHFFDREGKRITDPDEIKRIHALAIPPAYTDVWICPSKNGHLQATGRDAKGRKQYRYHPRWRETADANKYSRVLAFAAALPGLRQRVDADLARPGLPREKVLAAVVKLLETTLIRVGNEEYARTNKHYGLTTLRNRHVKVKGSIIEFSFQGKSGVDHSIELQNPRLARIVARCQELPGHELFQYLDEEGARQSIDSADVNAYLQEISGQPFTAKDFRTWAGTVLAAMALREFETFDSEATAKKNIVSAVERVAERLGNTPSVCRKCYVHPAIVEAYIDGSMLKSLRLRAEEELSGGKLSHLKPEEAAVLGLLRERLSIEEKAQKTGKAAAA
jgi:DNA topoisomerase-1